MDRWPRGRQGGGRARAAGQRRHPAMTRAGRGRPRGGERVAALLAGGALTLGACGYSFQGSLPSHVKTVAVPVFVNRTQEPAVESTITAAVVDALTRTGRLKVVPVAEADSIL